MPRPRRTGPETRRPTEEELATWPTRDLEELEVSIPSRAVTIRGRTFEAGPSMFTPVQRVLRARRGW